MPSHFLPYCEFHLLRLFRAQLGVFTALLASGVSLLLAIVLCLVQWQKAEKAEQAEQATRLASQHTVPRRASSEPVVMAQTALPAFRSGELVTALNLIADATKLPVNEVLFVLDDTSDQPYLRYRVTLKVLGSYPVIRRFTDRFRRESAHVSLDSITCSREGAASVALTCDLAFFAFYRKA
jgi:hypothetical protein